MKRSIVCAFLASVGLVSGCKKADDASYQRNVTTVDIKSDAAASAAADAANAAADSAAAAPQNKFGFSEEHQPSTFAPPPIMASPARSAPTLGISPAAAPGVAFSYRYAFVLPDNAIAAVQEQHASACEKLGPTQCRIIGMRYALIDKDRVEAYLQFKLSPELARGFGKDGIAAVQKAEGKLVDAAIEGSDVGSQIAAAKPRIESMAADLQRNEAMLAHTSKDSPNRDYLTGQIESLRAMIRAETQGQAAKVEQLANTPMTFTYGGEESFTLGRHPIRDAGVAGWASFVTMASGILLALGYGLPWLLLLAAAVWFWRAPWMRGCRQFMSQLRGKRAVEPAPELMSDP